PYHPQYCFRWVPRYVVPVGKSRHASGTRCAPLEPEYRRGEPSSPGDGVNVHWGRAGPSGVNVMGCQVRSLRIRWAVARAECQLRAAVRLRFQSLNCEDYAAVAVGTGSVRDGVAVPVGSGPGAAVSAGMGVAVGCGLGVDVGVDVGCGVGVD